MKLIPTIFIWDKTTRTVINKPLRLVDWVFQGKGIATRKYDGVAILSDNGKLFRRHEWRTGESIPLGFKAVSDADPKRPQAPIPGWVPVNPDLLTAPKGKDERALKQALEAKLAEMTKEKLAIANKILLKVNSYAPTPELHPVRELPNGTYELVGPDIRGNNDGYKTHELIAHGSVVIKSVPRTFDGLKKFLETFDGEGIVWHYKMDKEVVLMAKIKRRDFGFMTRISKEDLAMAYPEPKPIEAIAKE